MAGEIQLNSTTMATESSGTITLSNVNSATNRTNLGLGSMATQNANAVAITGGTINTVQPASGQSLTIKDEDGNTAITIGTDNTAAGYLSLNFGSYHGGSGGAGSGSLSGNTLDDYEEGTWTATLTPSTSGSYDNYSVRTATYTKIGNMVSIRAYVSVDNGGATSPTGTSVYLSLPFSSSSTNRSAASFFAGSSMATTRNAYIPPSSGSATLFIDASTVVWGGVGNDVYFEATYKTDY